MTLEEALKIIHSLGEATKMPCYTYSISAWNCHRGSKLRKIPGSVCNKCYAIRGNFARPTVQRVMNARQEAMDHPLWVPAMVIVLNAWETSGYFRWFASGDLQGLGVLLKICAVARQTPHIRHWLPTHEVGILGAFKRAGFTYPKNLVVRLSSDMIEAKPSKSVMKNLGVLGGAVSKVKWNCPAPKQENMCQQCRKCWYKDVSVVTYKYH
jgi:ribosomal protein L40E